MKQCMITFRSVTPAQRGEGVLKKAAMAVHLQRTPRYMQEKGCGYSLRLQCKDLAGAVALLRRQGIPFQKAYSLTEQGGVEEWEV